jgi:hypothetical protein
MCRRYVFVLIAVVVVLAIGLAGCNTGESDAMRAIRINADGTIAAMGNQIKTLEATMTSIGTLAVRVDALQVQLQAEQTKNTQLLVQQNGGRIQPTVNVPVAAPTSAPVSGPVPTSIPGAASGTAPSVVGTPSGLVIDKIVTARGVNRSNGCALSEVNAFTRNDTQIWAVASVRNLKRGITFTARWQVGGPTGAREFTYVSDFDADQTCINFYIEPRTLEVVPGNYSVSISAPNLTGPVAAFTIQ